MRVVAVLILFLLLGNQQALAIEKVTPPPDAPIIEYSVLLFEMTKPGFIDCHLFIAASRRPEQESLKTFAIAGLDPKSILSAKVTDYVFYETRHINAVEKIFWEDDSAKWDIQKLKESADMLGVVLFQQPFWSIHLANWIPTSLLDWHLMMREKFAGKNYWLHALESVPESSPASTNEVILAATEYGGTRISYNLPERAGKFTSTGVMIDFRIMGTTEENFSKIQTLIGTQVYYSDDRKQALTPHLSRIYLVQNDTSQIVTLNTTDGIRVDIEALVNRANSFPKESYYISDKFVENGIAYERFAFLKPDLPAYHGIDRNLVEIDDPASGYREKFSSPGKIGRLISIFRLILTGLISWIALFLIFHRSITKERGFLKSLGISITSYIIYALISLLFSFMFGFGFLLGVIAMESWIKRLVPNKPTLHLLLFGFFTSIITALSVQILT